MLKYLVLAYMLMGSDINPFDSQETKPFVPRLESSHFGPISSPDTLALLSFRRRYKNSPEIVAMTNLVGAYQRRDIHDAQKILRGASLHACLPPIERDDAAQRRVVED